MATVEQPLPESPDLAAAPVAPAPVAEVPEHLVIPMPQELQPDPVYGFEPPRDESQFTGKGYAYPDPDAEPEKVEEAE